MDAKQNSSVVDQNSHIEPETIAFTVAIPVYNGADRLGKVLEKLRSQIVPDSFKWEVIVVDNNSSDETADLIKRYQQDWSNINPLYYYFEPRQGIAFARQHAVEKAKGKYVGFLDDDTPPAPDWVSAAYEFGEKYETAGAYGGQVHGDFEVEPPSNFSRIESFFAIKKRGAKPDRYAPEKLSLPAGAGLVVRRKAWLESVPSQLVRTGRGGNDFEISLHLHRHGWEIWYNPEMHIDHHIPRQRLEEAALKKLIRNAGLCIYQLRCVGVPNHQKPVIALKIILGNLRRIIQHLIKYRGQVRSDLVTSCEMTFFISSMISPFYAIKAAIQPQRNDRLLASKNLS